MVHYPNIDKFDETNYYKVGRLPKPIPESMYNELFSKGVIPKKDLIIDNYYLGRCRNTSVAKWNGDKFIYMRNKFGHWSIAEINHLEDDNGFDLFIPVKITEPTQEQIINI